jgi:ketosteroid isomerase-like protein
MTAAEVGKAYVALCKDGKFDECLNELFSESAVSVEAGGPPGVDRTVSGLAAIRAKGKAWADDHEIHKMEVTGPYPNGDRFAVRFVFDVTNKPSKRRMSMDEIALLTVENGKITREEFFYDMG